MRFSAAQIGGKKVQQLVADAVSVPHHALSEHPIEQSRGRTSSALAAARY